MWAFVVIIIHEIGRFAHMSKFQKYAWERNETMEESLLDITADSVDSNSEKRLVNRYSS